MDDQKRFSRFCRVVLTVLSLVVLGPVSGRVDLHAQLPCTGEADGPPCPPRPEFSLELQAAYDTTRTTPMTVWFAVQGITSDLSGSMNVMVNGTGEGISDLHWSYQPGGAASGSAKVPLSGGTNVVIASFCNSYGCRADTVSTYYIAPPPPLERGNPIVAQEAGSQHRRSLAGCAGCAYTTLSYSTPSYRSLDQDRRVTLLYSSATSAPMGTVVLDVNANSTQVPQRMSVSLFKPGNVPVQLTNGEYEVFNYGATGYTITGGLGNLSQWLLLRASGWAAEEFDAGRSNDASLLTAANPFGKGYNESKYDRGTIAAGVRYSRNGCHQR